MTRIAPETDLTDTFELRFADLPDMRNPSNHPASATSAIAGTSARPSFAAAMNMLH